MSMAWVAAGTAILGAGTSIYGANKQSQAQKDANAANQASIEQADRSAWASYLLSRGLNPGPNPQFGVIPQNAQAVNTRLPLWANVRMSQPAIAARNPQPTPVAGLSAPAATRIPFIRRKTS